MKARLSNLPFVFAISLLGGVPILHSHALNDAVQYPQLLGLAICVSVLAVWAYIRSPEVRAIQYQIWWALGAFALLNAVSAIWSLNPAEAGFSAARWTLVLGLVMVSQIILDRWPITLQLVCKALIVSMSALALIGILQWRGIDPLGLSDRFHTPTALFANRNFYGSFLVLGIPFVGYGLFKLSHAWRMAALVAIALILFGIVISGARAALVPLLLGAAFVLPVAIWRQFSGTKRLIGLLAWGVFLGLLGWSTQFFFKQKQADLHFEYLWEDGHVVSAQSSSLDFRLIGWHHTLKMAGERPLQGYGAGNWKMQVQRFGLQAYDNAGNYGMVVPLHPHNEFLVALAELGIPGLLLLVGIWGMGCWGALRMALSRDERHDNGLGAFLVLGWIAFTVDASFSFPLERPLHLLLFCLLLALSMRSFPARVFSSKALRMSLGLALACVLWTGVDVVARIQADVSIRKVRDAKAAHQPQKVLQAATKATNWATQIDPVAALSIDWYVAMAQTELGQAKPAMEAIERAALVSPHHLAVRSGQASLLDLASRSTEAIQVQTDLLATFTQFGEGWLNLSVMQIHAGHLPESRLALQHVQRADFPERYAQVDAILTQAGY